MNLGQQNGKAQTNVFVFWRKTKFSKMGGRVGLSFSIVPRLQTSLVVMTFDVVDGVDVDDDGISVTGLDDFLNF